MENLINGMFVNTFNVGHAIINYLDKEKIDYSNLSIEDFYEIVIEAETKTKESLISQNLLTINPSFEQMVFALSCKTAKEKIKNL